MKNVLIPCAALALFFGLASFSAAGEPAAVSQPALDSMGLAGMQPLSDAEGMTIRGKGTFAGVWGSSTANFGGQSSTNSYEAGSSWAGHPALAKGGSLSFAGKVQGSYAADPTGSALSLTICAGFAGGGAFAFAH